MTTSIFEFTSPNARRFRGYQLNHRGDRLVPLVLEVRRFVDVPARVTQEEGRTGFLIHVPSAVLALFFFSQEGFSRSFPSSIVKSNFVY